mgnify:FL=1
MKVLYITNGDGPSGSSTALLNIISCLKDKAYIEVVFPRKKGDFSKKLEAMGIRCYHFRYTMSTYSQDKNPLKRSIYNLYTILLRYYGLFKLLLIVNRTKPDIIHTNNGPTDIGYRCAKIMGIRHVWHLREYVDKDFGFHLIPSFEAYTRQYADPANTCITITDGVKNHFHLKDNAVTIYDGALTGEPLQSDKKEKTFLFAGRLQEAKGAFSLLQAYSDYVRGGGSYNLVFAGFSPKDYELSMRNYIKENGLCERVKLLGYRTDVNVLMSRASALFVPSRFEGFGFITAEAMYNHCLVVGRDLAGTKEQFDNGLRFTGKETGLRFMDDTEMTRIMFDIEKNDYSDYVDRAFRVASSLYGAEKNALRVYNLYKKILDIE